MFEFELIVMDFFLFETIIIREFFQEFIHLCLILSIQSAFFAFILLQFSLNIAYLINIKLRRWKFDLEGEFLGNL